MDEAQRARAELARPVGAPLGARETSPAPARESSWRIVVAWHVADELHVLNVATRDDRRRRGIGRALMDRGRRLRARPPR